MQCADLVLRQGVHRVDVTRLVRMLAAPVEAGQLEALSLAGVRAGGDDCGPRGRVLCSDVSKRQESDGLHPPS